MLCAVNHGTGSIQLENRPIPVIKDPRDAIVRVTLSTICTSDLHILRGAVPIAIKDTILGHEFVGVVEEVGEAITNLKKGDRVSANCETFCGECWFCKHGYVNNCTKGGWMLGCRIDGCQAEYVRVPFADTGLTKIPENVSDKGALFVGDILSTAYWSADLCEIQKDDVVAIIGCGPVGMCAAQCVKYFGGRPVLIDIDKSRLEVAKQNDLADEYICGDPLPIIQSMTEGRGADSVIECAGSNSTLELAWKIARPNAIVMIVAMYEQDQVLPLPKMYGKNIIFKTGGVDGRYCPKLLELIASGKLNTDFLITHSGPLNDIEKGYKIFESHQDGCLKWAVLPRE